ncbi:MAG: PASTA domain-containing protein [bacterium]|nr:PASTA domain-containing protein [bacterium]
MLTSTKRTLCLVTTLTVCALLTGCPFLADLKLAPVTVPDVVGMLRSAAEDAILTATLSVSRVYDQYTPFVEPGVIASQDPVGGAVVQTGEGVKLACSAGPLAYWGAALGEPGFGEAGRVRQTSDYGFAVSGWMGCPAAGGEPRMCLCKTDAVGNEVWTRFYENVSGCRGSDVRETSDGGFILASTSTNPNGPTMEDMVLLKTDALGNVVWSRSFGGTEDERAIGVQQTTDGGYILAGTTESFGDSNVATYVVKTDSVGNTVWSKAFVVVGPDVASTVRQTSDGGYIIGGTGSHDMFALKLDAAGNEEWSGRFGGQGGELREWEVGVSAQETADGGYMIAGRADWTPERSTDFYLVKTDSLGNELWSRRYDGLGEERLYDAQETADGGFVLVGSSHFRWPYGYGPYPYVVKTDSEGIELWTCALSESGLLDAQCVTQTSTGGYVIGGSAALTRTQTRVGGPYIIGWEFPQVP